MVVHQRVPDELRMVFLLFVSTNITRKNPWSVAYFWLRREAAPSLRGEFPAARIVSHLLSRY
jgi:hypothetical protein